MINGKRPEQTFLKSALEYKHKRIMEAKAMNGFYAPFIN